MIQSSDFTAMLEQSGGADVTDATVEGDLDLSPLESVARPVRCRKCRFTGAVRGTDLIFERIVDFSGSRFDGLVDLSAAVFRDRAGFGQVRFDGGAFFESTRFLADASFVLSDFNGGAFFNRAQFGGDADLSYVNFGSGAQFEGARFDGGANFALSSFEGETTFESAGFGKRLSLDRVLFRQNARFKNASLAAGGNMGATFSGGFTFESATAGGATQFFGSVLFGEGAFNNFSSTGTLALDGIRIVDGELYLDQVSVGGLTMDVDQIEAVQGTRVQKSVLRLVERSGRESGDLALANRARFQFLDMEGAEKRGFSRFADRVFFRDVSGYLVRPLHPLATMAILILVGGVIRSGRSLQAGVGRWWSGRAARPRAPSLPERLRRGLLLSGKAVDKVLDGISTTVNVAVRRKPDHFKRVDSDRVADHARFWLLGGEFWVYKILLAIFLLALGNSNATVRQLLDAVTG